MPKIKVCPSGVSIDSSNWKSIYVPQRKRISKDNMPWIGEIIIELLVQYVEDDIQEVAASKENVPQLFPFLFWQAITWLFQSSMFFVIFFYI